MIPDTPAKPGRTLTALILEDSVVVLLDLQETLLALGVSHVLTASSICKALSVLQISQPDFAIVDYDIDGGNSLTVVDELIRRAIPLLLVTGYGLHIDLPERHRGVPLLAKPFSMTDLETKIARLFEG